MSTLKVWCEECKGGIARRHLAYCPKCGVNGHVEIEVVELPDGRAVVVDAKAWEAFDAAVQDLESRTCDAENDIGAGVEAERLIAALFTGGVYEAEAVVGRVLTTKCGHRDDGNHRVVLVENPADDGGCKARRVRVTIEPVRKARTGARPRRKA